MKKIMCLLIIGVFVLSGLGAVAFPNIKSTEITESISFSDPVINEENQHSIVKIDEANSWLRTTGYPMLPAYVKTYIFPFGTRIKSVDVTFSNTVEYELEKKIISTPSPITLISGKTVTTNPAEKPSLPEIYPEKQFSYTTRAGIDKNERVVFLTIRCYPVRYNTRDDTIFSSHDAYIKIVYELPDPPITFSDEYDMVIIAPKKFSSKLQPLVDHKNSHNIQTTLKTVEDIYKQYDGVDKPEQIKYFIKDAIETSGIDYVLLVGGMKGQRFDWYVPVRYSHLDDDSGFETSFISDLYYADIYKDNGTAFEDWDSNGNGIFAEWNQWEKDIIDLIPDVYLGRLPCRNRFEVKLMVDKIINYENTAFGQDWFHKMVVVGGDSAPGYEYYEGEEENKKALEYMSDFEGIKLWTSDGSLTGIDDVVSAISGGCGFLFFDGHGNPSTWSTHPPDDEETWITGLNNNDVPKLHNGDMLPVAVVGGCHNGQFNVTFANFIDGIIKYGRRYFNIPSEDDPFMGPFWRKEWVPECWAWRITSKINGGSIAFMAYTGLDWFAEGDYDGDGIPDCTQYFSGFANTHFFKNYGVNNLTILGQAHTQTLKDYIEQFPPMDDKLDCKTVEEFTLLGDPRLQIGGYS